MRNKISTVATVVLFIVAGCGSPTDENLPFPSPSVATPSVATPSFDSQTGEPQATPPPTQNRPDVNEPTEVRTPTRQATPSATTLPPGDSEPPATKFVKRWGIDYPNTEESAIIRAGLVACDLIEKNEDWRTDPAFTQSMQSAMETFGFGQVSASVANGFAVDANQNLCPTA